MSHPFIDTDVIIRLLTRDDLKKQEKAAALFEAVKEGDTHFDRLDGITRVEPPPTGGEPRDVADETIAEKTRERMGE